MANTIAHLMIAYKIYTDHPELINCSSAYYLGSIAPDTISSKPGCERNDKKVVHLREGIADADWLSKDNMQIFNARIKDFSNKFINDASNPEQKSFNIGYLVHLLADKWNHKTIRQQMLQIAIQYGIQQCDRAFYNMMVNDLEALDAYLLKNNTNIYALFADLTNNPVEYSLPGYIETEYIQGSIKWWNEYYLPSIVKRNLMYISPKDIVQFVDVAANEIYTELLQLINEPKIAEGEKICGE